MTISTTAKHKSDEEKKKNKKSLGILKSISSFEWPNCQFSARFFFFSMFAGVTLSEAPLCVCVFFKFYFTSQFCHSQECKKFHSTLSTTSFILLLHSFASATQNWKCKCNFIRGNKHLHLITFTRRGKKKKMDEKRTKEMMIEWLHHFHTRCIDVNDNKAAIGWAVDTDCEQQKYKIQLANEFLLLNDDQRLHYFRNVFTFLLSDSSVI